MQFSGSDSAPHPLRSKINSNSGQAVPAGVFTQPFATQLVILALEEAIERGALAVDEVTQDGLEQFLSRSGRRFYKLPDPTTEGGPRILLERKGETVPTSIKSANGDLEIGISKSDAHVFSLSWLT
jgi:dihydroorotase